MDQSTVLVARPRKGASISFLAPTHQVPNHRPTAVLKEYGYYALSYVDCQLIKRELWPNPGRTLAEPSMIRASGPIKGKFVSTVPPNKGKPEQKMSGRCRWKWWEGHAARAASIKVKRFQRIGGLNLGLKRSPLFPLWKFARALLPGAVSVTCIATQRCVRPHTHKSGAEGENRVGDHLR